MRTTLTLLAAAVLAGPAAADPAADPTAGMTTGTPELKAVSALAFAPGGVLLVGDPVSAAIYAIATGDTAPAGKDDVKLENVADAAGSLLGVPGNQVAVNDLKVNPASGNVYLAVTRKGGTPAPAILKLGRDGKLADVPMKDVKFSVAKIPNATEKNRTEAITNIGYADGKVIVAGLSNEDFASTLRAIPFPFQTAAKGAGVEIFHGAHGRYETNAPVRTFVTMKLKEKEEILAAYTCTPLVRIPVDELKDGAKVKGTTIAELGNRNRPLDMIVYAKDGKDYILMANSARGVMKIPAETFADAGGITEPVRGGTGTAGVKYETISALKGVEQLDKLDDARAVMLVKGDNNALNVVTVPLP
jgi:hypothetical protein